MKKRKYIKGPYTKEKEIKSKKILENIENIVKI
jgi:hypothetical protein